jgi:hypothetical protein
MSIQKCNSCGKYVDSGAENCLNCGAKVMPLQSQSQNSGCLIFIGVSIIVTVFLLLIFSITPKQNTPIQKFEKSLAESEERENNSIKNIDDFVSGTFSKDHKNDALTPIREFKQSQADRENNWQEAEKNKFINNIEENYETLLKYYKSKNIGWTKSWIDNFKKYGKLDYKDVSTIEKRISDPKYIKGAEALVAKENSSFKIKEREQMAKEMEDHYLSNGLDVKIYLNGSEKTSMRLECVLFSRPLIHQLTNDTDFFQNLKTAGFKKVVLSDKYRYTWRYDLTK